MIESALPPSPALAERLAGNPLLVMLDVDGTLAPIADRPELAAVLPETRRTLAALATRPGVHLVIVSGRSAIDARRLVGVAWVWAIGNHGIEMVGPNGEEDIDAAAEPYRERMVQAARKLAPLVKPVAGVVLEDKRWTLSVHLRLADPSMEPRLRRTVNDVASSLGLRVTEGKRVLEVRPPCRVDKGTAVMRVAQMLRGTASSASVLFMGDDTTDEDAFRALRANVEHAVTVRVTNGIAMETAAEFSVEDPAAAGELLNWLLTQRGGSLRVRPPR